MQNTQHPDDAAVDALATAMKAKLAKQRAKGYGGWDDKVQCSQQFLSALLRRHVDKGDPVDVANFCAFLLARGEGITAQGAPLPLLLRDIARDLGITVPQACIALKPLGNYSTNSAVTAEMARMLRDHFPAPAHPAEGVPVQAVLDGGTPGPWRVRKRTNDAGEVLDCFVTAPDCQGRAYDAHILGDDYDRIELKLADAELIVDAVNAYRAIAAAHPTQQGMDAQDAARWRMVALISRETMIHPDKRTATAAVAAYMHAVYSGLDIQGAVDAAIAAQAKQGAQA